MISFGLFAGSFFSPVGGKAMLAHQRAAEQVETSFERLATGTRINRGADDPADLITLEDLKSEFATLDAQITSIDRKLTWYASVDGARSVVADQVLELGGLVRQAANRGALGEGELLNIAELGMTFATEKVEAEGETQTPEQQEQTQAEGTENRTRTERFSLLDLRTGGKLDVRSGRFELMAEVADGAFGFNARQRGVVGTESQKLESRRNTYLAELEGVSAAIGQIGDTDYAQETAALVRARLLQDASLMVEKISRQSAQSVLDLIASVRVP